MQVDQSGRSLGHAGERGRVQRAPSCSRKNKIKEKKESRWVKGSHGGPDGAMEGREDSISKTKLGALSLTCAREKV